jgi:hypothetical protein
MSKTLLLDVDGVLVRDRLLLSHVRDNAVQYVRSKVPQSKNPQRLNAYLLKTYGHTAIGLQKTFGIDASDFDAKVYDRKLIDHLWSVLSGTDFQQDAEIIHDIAKRGQWKVRLFSNSPLEWTLPVALAISDHVGIHDHEYMKPKGLAYKDFSPLEMYMFVDDQVKNLRPVKDLPNWRPVHFQPEFDPSRPEFMTIGSIWEIELASSVFLDPVHDVYDHSTGSHTP